MSFNSTTYWLTNISARSRRNAECARDHRVFTVLGNDARYIVSVHTSSRGASASTSRSVLRVADNECTDRHHPDSAVIGARRRLARIFRVFLQGKPFHGAAGRIGWSG